ncbi:MAG: DUF4830 domain-containing protein [Ruminococcus sp.]|nr:DUF4830 domain-containing protein [Ruminococcus sp.]
MKKLTLLLIGTALAVGAVIVLRAVPRYDDEPEEVFVPASTAAERLDYFASHGWETEEISEKPMTIPSVFSQEYEEYARIQDKQGLPLRGFAGRSAELYLFKVKNYSPDNMKMMAELIVCDDIAVASMVYSEDGETVRMPVH